MSRIGRMPITVPAGVTVNVAEGNVCLLYTSLRLASHKLPIKTKIVARTEEAGE